MSIEFELLSQLNLVLILLGHQAIHMRMWFAGSLMRLPLRFGPDFSADGWCPWSASASSAKLAVSASKDSSLRMMFGPSLGGFSAESMFKSALRLW